MRVHAYHKLPTIIYCFTHLVVHCIVICKQTKMWIILLEIRLLTQVFMNAHLQYMGNRSLIVSKPAIYNGKQNGGHCLLYSHPDRCLSVLLYSIFYTSYTHLCPHSKNITLNVLSTLGNLLCLGICFERNF